MLTAKKLFSVICGIYSLPFFSLALLGVYAAFYGAAGAMAFPDTLVLAENFFLPMPLLPVKFFSFLNICAVLLAFFWPTILCILSLFVRKNARPQAALKNTIIIFSFLHAISVVSVLLLFSFATTGPGAISFYAAIFFALAIINDIIWFFSLKN